MKNLTHTLTSHIFHINDSMYMYIQKSIKHACVIICLYVDDMLIFGIHLDIVNATKSFLSTCFDMKECGDADVVLGITIMRTKEGTSLN